MRRAVIAALIVLFAIDTADACHRFSVWRYPRPQSCRFSALAPRSIRLRHTKIDLIVSPPRVINPGAEIPLPSLTDIDWGHPPDDEVRGRLWLRIIMQGKEDK